MARIDVTQLQAQVIVQGLMFRALATATHQRLEVRTVFTDEVRLLMPRLSVRTGSVVAVLARRMLRHSKIGAHFPMQKLANRLEAL